MLNRVFEQFQKERARASISSAPLIDMIFILLIFFVVTTTFVKETGIKIKKAKAVTTQDIRKKLIVIAIDKDGRYWYDRRILSLSEVLSLVQKRIATWGDSTNVVLVPDKEGRVEPLVSAMDQLRANNVIRMSIGTQIPDTTGRPTP